MTLAPPLRFSPAVVLPTYNNAATLVETIDRVRRLGLPVYVVDDGSSDGAAGALARRAELDPVDLCVRTHPHNRGKAAALRTGFAAAAKDGHTHAATTDTDGQLDPEQIPALLAIAERHPEALVLGAREWRIDGCPGRSRLGRRLSNAAIRLECGRTLDDSQCGLRVYPLDLFNTVEVRAEHFAFEAEVITRAAWAGRPIIETPVECRYLPRGERVSHWRPWLDTFRGVGLHAHLLLASLARPRTPALPHQSGSGTVRTASVWRRLRTWFSPVELWRQARRDRQGRVTLARGLAAGVFIANIPIYGFQTLASLYVARRFRLHPLAVVAGAHLSTPPVGPVLVVAAIACGHLLLHGSLPDRSSYALGGDGVTGRMTWLVIDWIAGGVIVGLVLAGATYGLTLWLLRWVPAKETRGAPEDEPAPAVALPRGEAQGVARG